MKLALLFLFAFAQQESFEEIAKRFENDRNQPVDEEITAIEAQAGVRVFDYSFTSPVDGRVPGLLVTPLGPGPHPLILYSHWMMKGSPLRSHKEFLDEAIVMAKAGSVCLLLDSPLVRPGVKDDPDPERGQGPRAALQMAREWRRAIDRMLARKDIDAARVAFVGHSFGAGVGAKLTGLEKRIQSFVLMANMYSLREYIYDDQNAEMKAEREKLGEEWIQSYFKNFPWDDSKPFVQRSAPAAVFLQNGRADKPIPERIVRRSFSYFQEPKKLEFYDAGHELNGAARRDRAEWLQKRLHLGALDMQALDSIPQLK